MNIDIESRRKIVVDWMIGLPRGENSSMIEKAIDNAFLSGVKNRNELINLISLSFSTQLDEYIKWCDDMHANVFTE